MTAPNLPGGALPGGSVNELGIADHAAKPQSAWEEQIRGQWEQKFDPLKAVGVVIGNILLTLEKLVDDIIMKPLSYLLAWILGSEPSDWDTLDELRDNLLPALMRLPIKIMATLLGLIPIVGNTIEQTLTNYLAATANTATTAASTAAAADTKATTAETKATSAQSAVGNLTTNIKNAVTGAAEVVDDLTAGAYDTIADIFGLADTAKKAALAAQQQLQDIQNETNTPGFNGTVWSTIFGGSEGDSLPSGDWSASALRISPRGYVTVPDAQGTGEYFTRPVTNDFQSDIQSNSAVVGYIWALGAGNSTSLLLRCNADITAGVYCRTNNSVIEVGRFTRSGSTWTRTPFATASYKVKEGDIVRFRVWNHNYYVLINNVTKLSHTDVGATAVIASDRRTSALSVYRNAGVFNGNSWEVASYALSDWLPAGVDVSTPSWRLRKGTAGFTALSVAAGGSAALPSGFMTVSDLATAVTVSNLGLGQITITTAGWYEMSFTAVALVDTIGGTPYIPCLWGVYIGSTLVSGPIHSGQITTVYLSVGDVVSPRAVAAWAATQSHSATSTAAIAGHVAQVSGIESIGGPAASFTGRKVA